MKLGGWWRLWIAVSAIYGIGVIAFTALAWPDVAQISDHPSFRDRMPSEAKSVMDRIQPKPLPDLIRALREADRTGAVEEAKHLANEISDRKSHPGLAEPIVIEMPNGYTIEIAGNTKKEESILVAKAYVGVLKAEVESRRADLLKRALLAWLAPTLAICAIGLVSKWVYAGFKRGKRDA